MNMSWFRGVQDIKTLDAKGYNGWWSMLQGWWNDHDNGVRPWTKTSTGQLTVTTASGGAGTITAPGLTAWSAYTPTLGGFGTCSVIQFFFRRVGDTLFVRGAFKTGTVSASNATCTIPSGLSIDYTKLQSTAVYNGQLGWWMNSGAAVQIFPNGLAGPIMADTSSAGTVYFVTNGAAAGSGFPNAGGSNVAASNSYVTLQFDVPISGWTF